MPYTPRVSESLSLLFFALATFLFLGALAAASVANTEPASPQKGRAKFLGYACVGLAFIAIGIPLLLQQHSQHPVPFAGTIVSARHTGAEASAATLHVQLRNGCLLVLHADRNSPYFRPGQALQGRYSAEGGMLLSAQFLGKDGKQQGVFKGPILALLPYGIFLFGAFFIAGGWILHRRDPHGLNNTRSSP